MNDGDYKWNFKISPIGNFRTNFTEPLLCPRCTMRLLPFGFPGALSRADNKTEICSECGSDEAMRQFAGYKLGGTDTWPIKKYPISHQFEGE